MALKAINPMMQAHLERVAMMQKQRTAQAKLRLKHQHDVQNAAAKMRQQMEAQALEHAHERMQNQPGTMENPQAGQPRQEVPPSTQPMPGGAPSAGPGF